MNNPLLARFADVPALIDPRAGSRFEADLSAILQHPRAHELMAAAEFSASDNFWFAPDDWRSMYRPYVVVDGILQIPVKGVLLYDFPWALGSYATGYAYIARALERGLADGNVRGIALIVYSYGGQGDGCFDLSNKIYAGRAIKPIKAFAQMAYSAGYAVASAAKVITGSSNAGIGSIGVVMTHLDVSRAMEEHGMKITFVHFGKHKVDGNAYQPLPDGVKARWQSWCDETGEQFCALVARNRGIDIAVVRATEAECYHASEALDLKLIDAIAPLDDAVTAFSPELSDPDDDEEGDPQMSTAASVPPAGQAAATATLDTARSEGHAAGKLEGAKEGTSAERTRISAILSSDEAKDKSDLANHLAFSTDMTADAAKGILAKAPAQAAAAAQVNPLAAAMAGVTNPDVGADANAGAQTDEQKAAAMASAIVGAYRGEPAKAAAK
ncbi:S49 family peptidase [Bradyrhizobium sp. JYMT SZCCT0428]|uniref:S49 family peptidase n=1 Tax=Bradyrhizobium sp. JYMT SZCCT0428 TaxID=2807673 RepID=UPI001BA4685E|nr:S49 family peptidase [Bradyrhizobium sp. JYMT SZCCT0428]MBR1150099.1 S49 family peptidase [Bradyrhizobium sp. JYMT SZCCT0428]